MPESWNAPIIGSSNAWSTLSKCSITTCSFCFSTMVPSKQRVEHRAILGLCSADFILEIHSSGNCSSTAFFASAVERDLCLKYVCSAQTEPHQSRGACAVSEEYLPVPSPYHSQLNRF